MFIMYIQCELMAKHMKALLLLVMYRFCGDNAL